MLTALLAVAVVAAAGALLVGMGLFIVAMPLTSAAVGALLLWAGWRLLVQRRRATPSPRR